MIYFREFLIIAGISLVGYGCWLIYIPAAPLAVGTLFLLFAVAPTFLNRRGKG